MLKVNLQEKRRNIALDFFINEKVKKSWEELVKCVVVLSSPTPSLFMLRSVCVGVDVVSGGLHNLSSCTPGVSMPIPIITDNLNTRKRKQRTKYSEQVEFSRPSALLIWANAYGMECINYYYYHRYMCRTINITEHVSLPRRRENSHWPPADSNKHTLATLRKYSGSPERTRQSPRGKFHIQFVFIFNWQICTY